MDRARNNMATIKANVENEKLSDAEFRKVVKTITDTYAEDGMDSPAHQWADEGFREYHVMPDHEGEY